MVNIDDIISDGKNIGIIIALLIVAGLWIWFDWGGGQEWVSDLLGL